MRREQYPALPPAGWHGFGPADLRPKRGWLKDRTVWWCSRCLTIRYGLVPFMHGGCPSPRHGKRCGTILLRVSP